jgi:hypothetical protein
MLRLLAWLVAEDLGLRRRPLAGGGAFAAGGASALARELASVVRQKAVLRRRILLWSAMHRLFHHWHVIHRPFAVVMYLFVLVHVDGGHDDRLRPGLAVRRALLAAAIVLSCAAGGAGPDLAGAR